MIKKVLGILFIIVAVLLTLSLSYQLLTLIGSIVTSTASTAYQLGYVLGQLFAILLMATATFFLFKYGIKWAKSAN